MRPNNITLQLTKRCNLNCKHCYSLKEYNSIDMSVNAVESLLSNLTVFKMSNITILGGEPFLHPQIFDILELSMRYNIFPDIVSNGLIENTIFKKLLDIGIEKIAFSLDGLEHAHSKIRSRNTFDRIINSINIAKSNGFYVRVLSVAMKSNLNSIMQLNKLLRDKIDMHKIIFYSPIGNGSFDEFVYPNEWLAFIDNFKSNIEASRMTKTIIQQPYYELLPKKICKLKSLFISSSGEVYPCILFIDTEYSIGNINNKSFNSIWESKWKIYKVHNKCIGYEYIFNKNNKAFSFKNFNLGCPIQCNKIEPKHNNNLSIF
jgi:MoaA/NifB/PqqE/SkfB family radical SAM enzyme